MKLSQADILKLIADEPSLIPLAVEAMKNLPALERLVDKIAALFPKPAAGSGVSDPEEPVAPVFSAAPIGIFSKTNPDEDEQPNNPVDAVRYGAWLKVDCNPKDQFGHPMPAPLPDGTAAEWSASCANGTPAKAHNGGALFNRAGGYACAVTIGRAADGNGGPTVLTIKRKQVVDGREILSLVEQPVG